jgi:hypothetical protein
LSDPHNLALDAGSVQSSRAGSPALFLIHATGNQGVSGTRNSFPLMAKTIRSKGRPVKEQGKRIKKIDARFTQDEYDTILELEKTLGVRKTDLVRSRLLQDARLTIVNAKELIGFIDSIGTEMGRCGNNINQLAKYANILRKKGVLSPVVSERFNVLFEQYIENQKQLEISLRKIIRMGAGK